MSEMDRRQQHQQQPPDRGKTANGDLPTTSSQNGGLHHNNQPANTSIFGSTNSVYSSFGSNLDLLSRTTSINEELNQRSEAYDNLLGGPPLTIAKKPHTKPSMTVLNPVLSSAFQAKHTRSRSAIDPIITDELFNRNLSSCSSTISSSTNGLKLSNSNIDPSTSHEKKTLSSNSLTSIEDKVARLYYRHGLFCARHPLLVILFAMLIVGISSFPIFNFLTISGCTSEVYVSNKFTFSQKIFFTNSQQQQHQQEQQDEDDDRFWLMKLFNFEKNANLQTKPSDSSQLFNHHPYNFHKHPPRWFQPNISYAFMQQIFVRSAVVPWSSSKMSLVDALRGPFGIVFELNEAISNFQLQYGNGHDDVIDLNDVCLQVFEPDLNKKYSHLNKHLPSFSCLMLSPANIWQSDPTVFQQDEDFLSTLLMFHDTSSSPLPSESLHNIFFGVHLDETGIRRTYGQNRQRTVTFAITIAFKKYYPDYIDGLKKFLLERYPLSAAYYDEETVDLFENTADLYHLTNETLNIYYQNSFTVGYLVPLFLSYTFVCLYMYFSVRKMEHVTNKLMYSAGTLFTVLMSVFMSFGICFRLNLNSALMVNRLLPYFVAAITFENMFIMTKSILTQLPHIDPKVKVAQGLSREGLSITKNLLAELTVLTIGSFMFPQFFQECCIFAAVCLISDFFVQSTFFVAFVSCDIQRVHINPKKQTSISTDELMKNFNFPKSIFASSEKPIQRKTPKRLRIVHFLARMRLVQRSLLLFLCACIGVAIYNAYLVLEQPILDEIGHNILKLKSNFSRNELSRSSSSPSISTQKTAIINEVFNNLKPDYSDVALNSSLFNRIKFTSKHPVTSLPNHHWSNLFSLYNISLTGRFVSFLPPILLSIPVLPERAKSFRNPADSSHEKLDKFVPRKFSNGEYVVVDNDPDEYAEFGQHFFSQWSKSEIYISIGLLIPSMLFLIYVFILLYRCVCTRNYAEWRAQFSNTLSTSQMDVSRHLSHLWDRSAWFFSNIGGQSDYQRLEQIERCLHFDIRSLSCLDDGGDVQDIDLLATSSQDSLVASTSMNGDIRVFDASSFENVSTIKRSNARMPEFDDVILHSSPREAVTNVVKTPNSNVIVGKSSIETLKTIVAGISVEDVSTETSEDCASEQQESSSLGNLPFRPVWCLEIYDRYVLAGCGIDGRLEVWDAFTGKLAFVYNSEKPDEAASITAIRASFWGIAVARLDGRLEILESEQKKNVRYSFCGNDYRDGRSSSLLEKQYSIKYRLRHTLRAHQQPISRLEVIDSLEDEDFIKLFGSRGCLITGSLDNTLKVFSLDSAKFIYTLNGHCGGISSTYIDPFSTATALSGCQLGQLFVWDLNTGTCLFSMEAHSQAEVTAICSSQLYYVSSGTDCRVCIWDRYSGHLVHEIVEQHSYCSKMLFLESHILVSARDSELVVWDVNDGKQLCIVSLASNRQKNFQQQQFQDDHLLESSSADLSGDSSSSGHQAAQSMLKTFQSAPVQCLAFVGRGRRALVCDHGSTLCVLSNPFVTKKMD